MVLDTVALCYRGFAYESRLESQECRWQAQSNTNTKGSHGKSGLKYTLYPLRLALLCYSPVGVNQMFKFKA